MQNLIDEPQLASTVALLKRRFFATRRLYGDTDQERWKNGGGGRFAPEAYIRPRK